MLFKQVLQTMAGAALHPGRQAGGASMRARTRDLLARRAARKRMAMFMLLALVCGGALLWPK